MKYGKDYGIKVHVPWYIKCPLVNRFFNTAKMRICVTAFNEDGCPAIGTRGTVRIPFEDDGSHITSIAILDFCFPKDESPLFASRVHMNATLLDVRHAKVRNPDTNDYLHVESELLPVGGRYKMGCWLSAWLHCKFAKRDYVTE